MGVRSCNCVVRAFSKARVCHWANRLATECTRTTSSGLATQHHFNELLVAQLAVAVAVDLADHRAHLLVAHLRERGGVSAAACARGVRAAA